MGRLVRLTREQRSRGELLRAEAAELQRKFWDALGRLEELIGVEVDSSYDLEDCSVEDLRSRGSSR
jgi:hypothetical protein